MKRLTSALFACLVVILACNTVNALTFNPFKATGRVQNKNLIIAANVVDVRLLADLAQYHSKQPILIISPEADGTSGLYFAPAGSKATHAEAGQFMEIVNFINPKRIIVLGGDDYVDRKFVDLARKKYPVLILDSDDWNLNAKSLGELLQIPALLKQYKEYRANIQATYGEQNAQ